MGHPSEYEFEISVAPTGTYLQRAKNGATISQTCPYKDRTCGDWCPLFSISRPEGYTQVRLGCHDREILVKVK